MPGKHQLFLFSFQLSRHLRCEQANSNPYISPSSNCRDDQQCAFSVRPKYIPLRRDSIERKLQALVYDILPSTTAVFSYAIGSRKVSANEQFFVGAQTVISLFTNNSNKTRRVIYSRQQSLHQHKQNHNRLNRGGTLIYSRGECISCVHACLGARLLPQSYQ